MDGKQINKQTHPKQANKNLQWRSRWSRNVVSYSVICKTLIFHFFNDQNVSLECSVFCHGLCNMDYGNSHKMSIDSTSLFGPVVHSSRTWIEIILLPWRTRDCIVQLTVGNNLNAVAINDMKHPEVCYLHLVQFWCTI